MTDSAVIVLPLPDSPTMPRHSPGCTDSDTPSIACTTPWRSLISVCRSWMSRSGAIESFLAPGPCGTLARSALLQPHLERVAERVADEVDGDDHEDDRDARGEDLPPVAVVDGVDAGVEHAAPVGLRRAGAHGPGGEGP